MINFRNNGGHIFGDWHATVADWQHERNLTYWQDGTSNQIVFLEKHIPAWALRSNFEAGIDWNGSWIHLWNDNRAHNIARFVSNSAEMIARSPQEPGTMRADIRPQGVEGRFTIGSSHPAVISTLLGDGSVRGVSKTTDPNTIWRLSHVSDGVAVSLP